MKCNLCHHNCNLLPDQTGKCRIIFNQNNQLFNNSFGKCALVSVEPIEKHFICHFNPGKRYLSVGLMGCNAVCGFCQNYKISQTHEVETKYFSPLDLVTVAKHKGVSGIAFSFNEPTMHVRYLYEVGANKNHELDMVVKTNGFATNYVWNVLKPVVDAYNVDIKGSEEDYQEIGGNLKHTRNSIEYLFHLGHHVEICYLVTPRIVHNDVFHTEIRNWLASLNKDVVVHLLYMYPFWKQLETYKKQEMVRIYEMFKDKIEYVYLSNLHDKEFEKYRARFF